MRQGTGRARALVAGLAACAAAGGIGAAAGAASGIDAGGESRVGEKRVQGAPYTRRCPIQMRAYEDNSASIFCGDRRKPFAAVDAETGRIRFYR